MLFLETAEQMRAMVLAIGVVLLVLVGTVAVLLS